MSVFGDTLGQQEARGASPQVVIAGAASTSFGIFVESTLRGLVGRAVDAALGDAGVLPEHVGLAVIGNAAAGLLDGQEMIRAQTALASSALVGAPAISVENACASGSSAMHLACMAVRSGSYEYVVVAGGEKMSHEDRTVAGRALRTALDLEAGRESSVGAPTGEPPRPVFMDIYAREAQAYMARAGATIEDFAQVACKAAQLGSLNPIAQTRRPTSIGEVLRSRMVAQPLTRRMCSSIGDGAAALVLCSDATARRRGHSGPRVLASVLLSGTPEMAGVVGRTVEMAYGQAGLAPADLDLVELHDAAASAELILSEDIGIAHVGEGVKALRDGTTQLGGRCPVNVSGGLLARGHAIGATGAAQLVELVDQLRGRSGSRQVENARVGLAQNAGGWLGAGPAVSVATILAA